MVDKETLRETVADVLDLEVDEITDEVRFMDLEVDSLMALEVVVVLEKKYGVKIGEAELGTIVTLQSAYELLLGKLVAA